jgi:very-short-patch-repair endonuclease
MDDLQIWTAQRAKDLRKIQTPHEEKLWRYLRESVSLDLNSNVRNP